jgi:hypothetical protein
MATAMGTTYNAASQLSFIPPKPDNVSESDYRRGRLMLENSYTQTNNAKNGIVAADYWNIAVAYLIMGQPKDTVYNFLVKSKTIDSSDFCRIALYANNSYGGIENTKFYKVLGNRYKVLIESCATMEIKSEKEVDIKAYVKAGGLNFELVSELDRILKLDQKHRAKDYNPELQNPLDRQNMEDIKKIIEQYGYPGKSLVGKRYDFVACAIIQRSNSMEYWDKYLPVVSDAVKSGELSDVNHLKMLLDRVYIDKIGAQIFGSKAGVNFADDETILAVKRKYGIDGEIDIDAYALEGGYDKKLISELDRIGKLDQKFRSSDQGQQKLLDDENIKDIETLTKKYGYPGRKLAGKKYENVTWAVIQHAGLSYQEKYLPLIHKAVLEQQLEEAPLKMLIDRIHWKKTGSQIFGTQAGVEFADDKTIAEVKKKYSLK